jgi:hypothetical protein
MIKLSWKVDEKGDQIAIAPNGQYRVTCEGDSAYRLRFAGYPIALAATQRAAKDYASIHVNR